MRGGAYRIEDHFIDLEAGTRAMRALGGVPSFGPSPAKNAETQARREEGACCGR